VPWHAPVIPAVWESANKKSLVQVSPDIGQDPFAKIINAKMVDGMAQVVENLPSMHNSLKFNP
jgi:hypothetical protein